jgi:DNA-directed RNA polymerase subunit alpha
MFQVQCLKSTTNKVTEVYGKYSVGPFLKGQSTTIGNALRRVLLSNLQGLAITGVRITGVDHEFSTIPSIKEDVVDILLNLKTNYSKGEYYRTDFSTT